MTGRDLTRGPVPRWLLVLSLPVFLSFVLQSLYALGDLFFVGYLGGPALAAVGIALNSFFLVLALAQTLGAGALALISQAYGRRDEAAVRDTFQQIFWMLLVLGAGLWAAGWALAGPYFDLFTADAEVRAQGVAFFTVYSATFLLQSFLIGMAACWRAIGSFLWPTALLGANVMLNLALDPLLIFGWGPVPGLGVVGAAWATVIAQAVAVALYLWMILSSRRNALLRVRWPFRVDWRLQGKLLRIGVPSGMQFLLATVALGLTYRAVRPFGAEVSAAVGVGFRILQSMLYPAISVAAAAASLTGQNTGARRAGRVRETLYWAAALGVGLTLAQWLALVAAPRFWLGIFAEDPAIVEAGTSYLWISGFAMVLGGFGVVVTFASQALGRTMLPLGAVVVRVALFGAALVAMHLWLRPSPELIFLGYTAAVVVESGVLGWIFRGMLRGTHAWETGPAVPSQESHPAEENRPPGAPAPAVSEAPSGAAP